MRGVEHTPEVSVLVPWSAEPVTMRCRPFYAHREGEPGRQFSNLFPASLTVDTGGLLPGGREGETFLYNEDGLVRFPSTENVFQAAKALYPIHDAFVRGLSPLDAARAGQGRLKLKGAERRRYHQLGGIPYQDRRGRKTRFLFSADGRYARRPKWESLKREVMFLALEAKFDQHPDLWDGLVGADLPTFFIEHTENDIQWGDGGDGFGTNFLGKLLTMLLWGRREGALLPRAADDHVDWMFLPNHQICPAFYATLPEKEGRRAAKD